MLGKKASYSLKSHTKELFSLEKVLKQENQKEKGLTHSHSAQKKDLESVGEDGL